MAVVSKEPIGQMNGRWTLIFKGVLVLNSLLVIPVVGLFGYLVRGVHHLETRVTVIESNRFTAENGMELVGLISELRVKIAAMPSEIPPQWFREKVDRMELTLSEHLRDHP